MTPDALFLNERLNVLVADDDAIFRQVMESRLTRENCTVLPAGDGGEAWRVVRSQQIDVAVVDFEMPGLDGIALIQCLRGHLSTRHIPIIMCTSRDDSGAMRAAVEAGASMFLTKPVNWKAFDSHIGHLLQLSRSGRRVASFQAGISARDAQVHELIETLEQVLQDARQEDPVSGMQRVASAVSRFRAEYGAGSVRTSDGAVTAAGLPHVRQTG